MSGRMAGEPLGPAPSGGGEVLDPDPAAMGRGSLRTGVLDVRRSLSQHRSMAAVTLPAHLRSSRSDPSVLKAAVDRRLGALLSEADGSDDLAAALRYSVLTPGKRIRPILTILAGWELGPQDLRALDAGCALEMVHAASLVLDDMPAMDDALLRRGQPATHIRFGEDVAMLTAITLLSLGYSTLAAMDHVSSETRCRLVAILARAVGPMGLAGGQFADLRPGSIRGPHAANEINRRKTGALFTAAAEFAAVLHGAPAAAAASLHRSIDELGQAYQIFDDLADSAAIGRGGKPEDDDKVTVLSIVGLEAARLRLRQHLDAALAGLSPTGGLANYVHRLFEAARLESEPA